MLGCLVWLCNTEHKRKEQKLNDNLCVGPCTSLFRCVTYCKHKEKVKAEKGVSLWMINCMASSRGVCLSVCVPLHMLTQGRKINLQKKNRYPSRTAV